MIDKSKLENIEVNGIDMIDYPEFCDASFISSAEIDGVELTDEELLEELNAFVYNEVIKFLF